MPVGNSICCLSCRVCLQCYECTLDKHCRNRLLICRGVRIVAAAAGEKHSLALATHGAVYSWGCGRHGQLGVPEVVHFQQNNPGVQPAMHTPQFVRALDPLLMEPWDRSALRRLPPLSRHL